MGDPLSVTASVASLLSLGLQSTEYLYNYYTTCRDQHQDIARITDQLGGLLKSLQIIDEIVRTRTSRPNKQSIIQSVEWSIAHSEDTIRALQDEAGKFKKEPADNWKKKAVAVGRRAAYPFKRSTLEDLGEDVNYFRGNLSVALQALQLKEHQNTQNDIEADTAIVKNIQAQNVSADLREWLRAPDATVNFNVASAKRHMGTGQWLVQGPAYTAWLKQDNSFLWLYGFAGCGKSVLCSTAIQHAFRHQQSSANSAAAFFFFTFNDKSKQDASAALRALLLQLCGQVPGLEADLTCLKDSYNHGTAPVPVLLELLRRAATQCHHVYILLDALDESPAGSSRLEVLSVINTMRQWQLPGLHLLVTSRDASDIRAYLQFPALPQGVEHVTMKNDSVQEDISQFVSFKVDHDRELQRWGDHQKKIKSYLVSHAGGVFRWVECQLEPLRQCPLSEQYLEECLQELPESLDKTYERMLCSIKFKKDAQRILSLLCYASRPLSIEEVIEALAVDINDHECYNPKKRSTGGADHLIRICPGLIEICLDTGGTQGVQIAHFSVQEYLLSDRIRSSKAKNFALLGPLEHGRISKACLLYLNHNDFRQQNLSTDLVKQYAFARYAAEHWHYHYHEAGSPLAQQLSRRVVTFLTTRCTRERWVRLHDPDQPQKTNVNYYNSAKDHPSATYYASLLGLDSVLTGILSISVADVNAQGGYYGNALQAASSYGHEKVVQMLLDKGADVNAEGGKYGNALQAASADGHEKVVQMLLDKGADINAPGGVFSSALQAAFSYNHKKVVQMLLGKRVDINTQGGNFSNPLVVALYSGNEKVVQMLLDKGTDANTQAGKYGSVLLVASSRGDEKVVQMLLSKGADVNAQGGEYSNALQVASSRGHEKVVQMLLDKGADVNTQGGWYGNALQAASSCGDEKVVQMLLDKGVDVNTQGGWFSNALQAASGGGHEKVVQMLLDKGADVNTQGGKYGNALQAASTFGHEKVVQMLLDKKADVNAQGGCYGNALQAASAHGHEKVVQMLLDKGADINAQGGEYSNALQAASADSHEKVVQMLLDKGADANAQGGWYGNALQAASVDGHEKVVQMLLDKGADVNAQGGYYGNALQAALYGGDKKVVQMLLDKGADVNAQGGYHNNTLQAASGGGHEKVVQMLLDKGVDVNTQGGKYGNALQAASSYGHEKVVQMLLDKWADANAQGGWYGNALQAASANSHEKVVQMLLDKGADVNTQGGNFGNALQAASYSGNKKVVQMLLDKGADVNAQGGEYGNALQAASSRGYEKVVQMLLYKGADVITQGGNFGNALQAASSRGHEKVVQMLLDTADVTRLKRNDSIGM